MTFDKQPFLEFYIIQHCVLYIIQLSDGCTLINVIVFFCCSVSWLLLCELVVLSFYIVLCQNEALHQ